MAPGSPCMRDLPSGGTTGTLETIFRALPADADMENLSLDSTGIEVHESANGGRETADKAVGRSICILFG